MLKKLHTNDNTKEEVKNPSVENSEQFETFPKSKIAKQNQNLFENKIFRLEPIIFWFSS